MILINIKIKIHITIMMPTPTTAGRLAEPPTRSVNLSIDEERIQTRPMPADRVVAASPVFSEAEIGTELPLSVPPDRAPLLPGDLPSDVSQRRQRVETGQAVQSRPFASAGAWVPCCGGGLPGSRTPAASRGSRT